MYITLLSLFIGAVRVYFKSKKSLNKRKQSGKQDVNAAMSRRRQRRHNVSENTRHLISCFEFYRKLVLVYGYLMYQNPLMMPQRKQLERY